MDNQGGRLLTKNGFLRLDYQPELCFYLSSYSLARFSKKLKVIGISLRWLNWIFLYQIQENQKQESSLLVKYIHFRYNTTNTERREL